jgi:hypothetical protein
MSSFQEIIINFSSKESEVQQSGLEKVKKMMVDFDPSKEFFLISIFFAHE